MGKLQKTSNENNISFLDNLSKNMASIKDRNPEMKKKVEESKDRSWAVLSSCSKLSHNSTDNQILSRSGHSIRSAACGSDGLNNNGGSGKFVGSSRNGVNLDTDITSNKEKTLNEKKSSKEIRKQKEAEYKMSLSPKIGENDVAHSEQKIASAHVSSGKNGWVPAGKISIFDSTDFERLHPTMGESMSKKESSKDNSWQKISKASKIQDNNLNNILDAKANDNSHANTQKDSTDRLFSALFGKKE